MERHHPLEDEGQLRRHFAVPAACGELGDEGEEQLVDAEGDVGVRFEVELAVDVGDERQHQSAEDLAEERVSQVKRDALLVLEVLGKQLLEVGKSQVHHHLEGLVPVDGLDDPSDVVQVLAEDGWSASAESRSDEPVDLVKVLDGLPVDPDEGDDVEEGPALGEVLRRDEDGGLDCG
jgi:hypothetical protein